jgi:hypothetical protein
MSQHTSPLTTLLSLQMYVLLGVGQQGSRSVPRLLRKASRYLVPFLATCFDCFCNLSRVTKLQTPNLEEAHEQANISEEIKNIGH